MKYEIKITAMAQNDFEHIYMHISNNLHNKQAALKLTALLDKNIKSLSDMPERYALVKDNYLKNMGIRFISVKNYIIFYTIDENKQTVYVIRILYGKRNWIDILHKNL